MFDDLDPTEFEDTARSVVEACADEADAKGRGRLLAEAGLIGVSASEDVGGLGLPLEFAVPVVAAAGAGLLGYPLIEAVVLAKALAGVDPERASKIVSGEVIASVAWSGVLEDGVMSGVPMGAAADDVLLMRADGSAVLAPAGNAVKIEEAPSLDVDMPGALVRLSGPAEGVEFSAEAVAQMREDANILRSAFVRGSAQRCLSLAADYAQDRSQFGKLLSANQVLRHRLSRDALAVETMKNALTRAVRATGGERAMAVETAWLGAAHSGVRVAESAIQVFGGMGFTWEVPVHRHLRQMRAQAGYGAAAAGIEELGDRLISSRSNTWYKEISHVV